MSNINPNNPTEGQATTQSVRDNFLAAANESDAGVAADAAQQIEIDANTSGLAQEITDRGDADDLLGLEDQNLQDQIDNLGSGGWNYLPVQVTDGAILNFDFAIPAGANEVLALFTDLGNFGGGQNMIIEFGVGGVPQQNTYRASAGAMFAASADMTIATASFIGPDYTAGDAHGSFTWSRMSPLEKWLLNGNAYTASSIGWSCAGRVELTGPLDLVRIQSGGAAYAAGGDIMVAWK